MNPYPAPYPRFLLFRYFIEWFVESFGIVPYILTTAGCLGIILSYTFVISLRRKNWDSALMILIFSSIVFGAIVGAGLDVMYGMNITSFK